MRIPDFTVSSFSGLNTFIKDRKTLKPGVATDSLNWCTEKFGDHIELRRGKLLLGQTRATGSGKVTGMGVGTRYDGVQVLWKANGKKVSYYDSATDEFIEVGTDLLPAAADGDDIWFHPYQNLAGSFVYLGSDLAGTFKVPLANPGSAVDQEVNNHRFAVFRFAQNRGVGGQRNGTTAGNKDTTGLYLSDIDKGLLSLYTQVTGEAYGTGNGSTATFAHTLTQRTGKRTAMYVSVTDGTETFTDDRNGTMVGTAGGTGTVNYATGDVSVTFAAAPTNLQAITCSYYYEDATSDGPLDFDTSSTGAGKAKTFRQDDGGGNLMAVIPFLDVLYCFHERLTWATTTTLDDTQSTNLPYRAIGIPYPRAAKETADGVLLVDTSNPNVPKVRRLELAKNTNNLTIVPTPLSDALDLSIYAFDKAVAFRWGDYEIVCCQKKVRGVAEAHNSVMLVRNVFSGAWDRLDYGATVLDVLDGALMAGDPISNNVYTLFSGWDDDESEVENYWQDGMLNLGTDRLKRAHHMRVTGLIQTGQTIEVYLTLDDGKPVRVFTIEGNGTYVDQGITTTIGSSTIGSGVIGGGGEETAHPYDVTFPIHTDIFQYVSTKFRAVGIGYAAVNSYSFKDIRDKGSRSLPTKTV